VTGLVLSLLLAVSRPAYNTGTGFFTLNAKIYDANGNEFIPRGMDASHYDCGWCQQTVLGNYEVHNTTANAMRVVVYTWDPSGTGTNNTSWMNNMKGNSVVTIPGCFFTSTCTGGTTNTNTSSPCLSECVTQWTNSEAFWHSYEPYSMINLANEWGAGTDTSCNAGQTAWENAYVSAVASMRSAGFLTTIVIDAGGSGTRDSCFSATSGNDGSKNHAQYIYDQDSQHNILFSWHDYGQTEASSTSTINSLLAARTATAGAYGGWPLMIGEFADAGQNGSTVDAVSIMRDATNAGIGWLAWAIDNGGPWNIHASDYCNSTGTIFKMLTSGGGAGQPANCTNPGACTSNPCNCTATSDLSTFGDKVYLDRTGPYGLFYTNPPKATIFAGTDTSIQMPGWRWYDEPLGPLSGEHRE